MASFSLWIDNRQRSSRWRLFFYVNGQRCLFNMNLSAGFGENTDNYCKKADKCPLV